MSSLETTYFCSDGKGKTSWKTKVIKHIPFKELFISVLKAKFDGSSCMNLTLTKSIPKLFDFFLPHNKGKGKRNQFSIQRHYKSSMEV